MYIEAQKKLKDITILDSNEEKNGLIEFDLNWKNIFLSTDWDTIKTADCKTAEDFEALWKYIFSFSGKLYYPNFKNEQFLESHQEYQFVNKENLFKVFNVFLWLSNDFTAKELQALQWVLKELETKHLSIYHFFKFQKSVSILLFLNYFYEDKFEYERVIAISSIAVANDSVRCEDEGELIDMEYIIHCGKKNNFTHIWDYLKKEIQKILEEILTETS